MNSNSSDNTRPVHDLTRLLYLQGLVVHRRVLLVGDELALAEFLITSRARFVSAVAEGEPKVPWPDGDESQGREFKSVRYDDLPFRDGMFDVAIVPDLTAVENPVVLLNELRRVVGPRGAVVVASPNPACENRVGPDPAGRGFDYYEFYDLVADAFPSVQMVGQSPFVGYAVADLASGEEDPAISFDAGLLEDGSEEIEWFIAVCAEDAVEIEAYSVIQVPLAEAGVGGGASAAELDEALERVAQLDGEKARLGAERDELTAQRERLDSERDKLGAQLGDLEQRVQHLDGDLGQARLELGNRGVKIETLEKDVEHERSEAEAARERAVKVAKQFDDERKASQAKQLEQQMSQRTADIDLQNKVRESAKALRQAEARAEAAEAARDEFVDRMREDATEFDKVRAEIDSVRDELERVETASSQSAAKAESLTRDLETAHQELHEAVERQRALVQDFDSLKGEAAELRGERDALASHAGEERERFEQDVTALEVRLAEAARELTASRGEVDRREAIVRDLVVQLGQGAEVIEHGQHETVELSERVEALRVEIGERDLRNARLEGELQAAKWRSAELEVRLEDRERLVAEEQARLEDELNAALGASSGHHRARVDADLQLATVALETEQVKQELDDAIARIRELEADLASLQGARSGQHRARVEAELQLATASLEAEQVKQELDDAIARIRELEDEQAGLQGANSGQHRARVEAELQLATAAVESTQVTRELDDSIARVRELEDELDNARVLGTSLETELKQLADGLSQDEARVDGELSNTREALEQARETIQAFEQQIAAAQRSERRCEEEIDQQRERITRLEDDLGATRDRSRGLESEVSEAAAGRVRVENELADLGQKLEAASDRAQNAESRAGELNARAERAEGELVAVRAELTGNRERVDEMFAEHQQTRAALERELETQRGNAQEFRHRLERSEPDLDELKRERDELVRKLDETEQTSADATKGLEAVRQSLSGEVTRTRQAGADAARLAGEVDGLERLLTEREHELKERLEEMGAGERALTALRDDVSRLGEQMEALRETNRAEQVRSQSLLREVDRLGEFEDRFDKLSEELDGERERRSALEGEVARAREAANELERETVVRAEAERDRLSDELLELRGELDVAQRAFAESQEARQEARRELEEQRAEWAETEQRSAEMDADRERLTSSVGELEQALEDARGELESAGTEIKRAKVDTGAAQELAEIRLTSARQAEEVKRLFEESSGRESLLESLTTQLQEREQRATSLERKARGLEEQIHEHESDTAAWEMELNFRSSRISQLETELGKLQDQLAGATQARHEAEQRASRPPQPSQTDLASTLKQQVVELNELLGDKDAQLLIAHTRAEESIMRLQRVRQAMQNVIGSGQADEATAVRLHDIVAAMERDDD
ncbi:MAG: hypothetical protein JRF63_04415 [Deltaproteobacteria bacterium]|nr:hypothetical protein [Deltaproteobacteria bacterium]